MFVIMPYFANSDIVEGRFHHYSEIESTTDNIESSQYGRSIDYHLYPPSWRKFENRNFMSKSSRWPYWAADLVSNKRHSAAKLQNDVRRTMPRPLAMSIQLSSVLVSSIGWDVFWEVCNGI